MGTDVPEFATLGTTPVHPVSLYPFLIDKFKVTNARYRACVDAGACTVPAYATSGVTYTLTPGVYEDYPVNGASWSQAVIFCNWDGGRVLPTEAEWEKAAKGPAPRQVPYAWGDDTDVCVYVNWMYCPVLRGAVAADALDLNVSYYGVREMGANYRELVQDFLDWNYYSTSPAVEPTGPATGLHHVARGTHYSDSDGSTRPYRSICYRNYAAPDEQLRSTGFRCARPVR